MGSKDSSHSKRFADSGSWTGQIIGDYLIVGPISSGSMGVVYLAKHQTLDRPAAIKFLSTRLSGDPEYVERFLREARGAARLNHPSIVSIYEAGRTEEEDYFLIMEYVDGRDLASVLDELSELPVPAAVGCALQAAAGLGHAHRKNIIHRDVKPANLLLTQDGAVKVSDLGLAKVSAGPHGDTTRTGTVLGTPYYISPEQIRQSHEVDHRADIYSLGASLFHLVTGLPPYLGSSAAVIMAQHLDSPVPEPHQINPALDRDICKIIRKMMAKDPAGRYQTMEAVETALTDYQSRKTHAAHPLSDISSRLSFPSMESHSPQGSRPGTGKKRIGRPFVISALLFAILAAGLYWKFRKPVFAAREPVSAPAPAQPPAPLLLSKPPMEVHEASLPPEPRVPPGANIIADFNGPDRVTRLGGQVGSWNSSSPDPAGFCEDRIDRTAGWDGSGVWRLEYDVTTFGAFAGGWIQAGGLELDKYQKLFFRTKGGSKISSFVVELKADDQGSLVIRRSVVKDAGNAWQEIQVDLAKLRFPPGSILQEVAVVIDSRMPERKGYLLLDDIALVRRPDESAPR